MLNSLSVYFEAGQKAGYARKQNDEALAKFETDWYRRAVLLERAEDRSKAREQFDLGYSSGRGLVVRSFS